MELKDARRMAEDIENFCQEYKEISNTISDLNSITKSVKRLIKKKNNGSRLVTTGVTLILLPDPASDVVGASLIVAGVLLNKVREHSIADIYSEIRKINASLEKIGREIL